MPRVSAERFFDGHTLHGSTSVDLDDAGTVVAIGPSSGRAEHALLSPGLVDVQMNGWGDVDVAGASPTDLARLDELLWREGTSHWLGTIVTAPLETMAGTLARLDSSRTDLPGMLGIHTEGPFLGGRPGAHDTRHIVAVEQPYLSHLPASVRMVTIAAEAPGAPAAIESLVGRGVRVSIGHSAPTRDQWDLAVSAGAHMVTHLFNGMSGVHHRDGGLALWALVDDRITCGLIADGHHVADEIVALVFLSAPGRVVLVSDSVAWKSPWALARGVETGGGVAVLPDGTLTGSTTSLLGCLRHVVLDIGIDLQTALRAVTSRPAGLIGQDEHDVRAGTIAVGHRSDVIALDEGLRVVERFRAQRAD
ncbi:MAG: N-acetylglucosamine-6-phosphate deacetylase [Actinobacteria bacterium]|nr:N-acetylglucosamine-6-phosphate deacetylase [Actinomycetota bacterium]